ncbi:MAG: DsbA family protein [Dehalococcoidia bacterium]
MSEGRKGSGAGRGGSVSPMSWAIVSANVLAVVALVLGAVALVLQVTEDDEGGGSSVLQPSPTAQASPTPTQPTVVPNVSVDDDPSLGPEDAPVTIVEFSEFLCPYCWRFALQTLPQIKQAYEGKIRYVYRDFIVHGEPAVKISEASECADDQGKFWEYHDKLWEKFQEVQQQVSTGTDALLSTLKGYASDLGLDTATFDECLDTGKHTEEVLKDAQDGRSYGVSGTPSFFINGRLVVGAIPFEDYQGRTGEMEPGFKSIIDAALQEAEAGSAVPSLPSGSAPVGSAGG